MFFGFISIFEMPDKKTLVIDQHAFHERILLRDLMEMDEMLSKIATSSGSECIDLGEIKSSTLKEYLDKLESMGFKLGF